MIADAQDRLENETINKRSKEPLCAIQINAAKLFFCKRRWRCWTVRDERQVFIYLAYQVPDVLRHSFVVFFSRWLENFDFLRFYNSSNPSTFQPPRQPESDWSLSSIVSWPQCPKARSFLSGGWIGRIVRKISRAQRISLRDNRNQNGPWAQLNHDLNVPKPGLPLAGVGSGVKSMELYSSSLSPSSLLALLYAI